jgi:putative ABC transport system permease protein
MADMVQGQGERQSGRLGARLDGWFQDVRYSVRTLRNRPGFTVVAVLILAIGIGASTSLFSTAHSVMRQSAPFPGAERLVVALKTIEGQVSGTVSRVDYFDVREMSGSFEQLAAVANFTMDQIVTGGERPMLAQASYITWNLLPALGVRPVLGSGFGPDDEAQSRDDLILISHGFWQTHFGGMPEVIGRTLAMDGRPKTVVGVMPAGFRILFDADVWRLIHRDGPFDAQRDSHSHVLIGRLTAGTTLAQAREEAAIISRALAAQYPETNTGKGLWITDFRSYMVRSVRTSLLILMVTTVLVLVIASANVAGLLLARSEHRRMEMAMRSALGASRGRLVRQLLTESVIFTITAGMLGLGVAHLMQHALLQVLPLSELGIRSIGLNAWALGFALLLAVVTGLLVGVTPALHGTNLRPAQQLRAGTHTTEGLSGTRLRSGFVVLQIALTVVLLVGSGLLLRSLTRLTRVELGFDAENLLTAHVQIDRQIYETREARAQFFTTFLAEVEAIPGVTSAALSSRLPIRNPWQDWGIRRADQPVPPVQESFSAMVRWVSPAYFRTMGIPHVMGRDFSAVDAPGRPYAAVLSESTVRHIFSDRDPLGQRVKIGWEDREFVVVGVVADARLNAVNGAADAAAYMSSAQIGATRLQLAVRTALPPAQLVGPIEDVLRRMDSHALFARPLSMEAVLARELAGIRVMSLSSTLFAGVALLLAAIGLYGVLAYQIRRRMREFGIRLAMGATDAHVFGTVLRRGVSLIGYGVGLGVAAAYPASLLIRRVLFDTSPLDLVTYGTSIALLILVAIAACTIPASRAMRVNIVEVLRLE